MNESQFKGSKFHPNVKDITGQQFGDWTVICRSKINGSGRNARWLCKCKCGAEVVVLGNHLRTSKSLRCRQCARFVISQSHIVHGQAGSRIEDSRGSRTYRRWTAMRARAASNKTLEAMFYAKRDIKCCERWASYENFLEDMGECPSDKHTLDRINNDLGYGADNCRWATQKQQQRNRSSNRIVNYKGTDMCVAEFAELLKMPYHKVAHRVRTGWTTDQIAAAPFK